MDILRTPPHNVQAEQSLIGAVILDNQLIDELTLKPSDFYRNVHESIFETILSLYKEKGSFDEISVMECNEHAEDVYLHECTALGMAHANYKHWEEIIKEKSILRQQINLASEIIDTAYNGENAIESLKLLDEIGQEDEDFYSIKDVATETVEQMEEYQQGVGFEGLMTGIKWLDFTLNGLRKTDMILCAGRPGCGKTAFALQIGKDAAMNGKKVAIFNLEMSRHQLVKRMIVNESRVHLNLLKTRKAETDEWQRIHKASGKLYRQNIFISDNAMQTVDDIYRKCKRIKKKYGLDLVIIDYIQLMKEVRRFNSSNEKVGYDSRMLKVIAKQLDVPVFCLSQLNRAVDQRQNKRPIMSDLRDSGSLEQDADSIIFLYREDYYRQDEEGYEPTNRAEVHIAKNRHGETKTFEMDWQGGIQRFSNL